MNMFRIFHYPKTDHSIFRLLRKRKTAKACRNRAGFRREARVAPCGAVRTLDEKISAAAGKLT
jgi:hypothetical protein